MFLRLLDKCHMHFKRQHMVYPAIVPPIEFESFRSLDRKQAQQLFDWYISCIPDRVGLLEECFNDVWHNNIQFDYSIESLDLLWRAFIKHIKYFKKNKKQIIAENADLPTYVLDDVLEDNRYITNDTKIVAFDIAMYFGETLVRNLPGIKWRFVTKPKNLVSVNRPVLIGFKGNDHLEPTGIILVGCLKFLDKRNPSFLIDTINVWKEYLK